MSEEGHAPDEIVFNSLLSGALATRNLGLAKKLFEDMVGVSSLKPTMATFSILLKLHVQCGQPDEAMQMLKDMESKYGVVPERRLFIQLTHLLIRARAARDAVETYRMMCAKWGVAKESENDNVVAACIRKPINMLEPAISFLGVVLRNNGSVSDESLREMLKSGWKKQGSLARNILELLRKHNVPLGFEGVATLSV